MSSQLKWKFVFIAAVILVCIYGLIGLPQFPHLLGAGKTNLADRIKLGLDLKGGSHLVLQVQLEEAIGQRCDEALTISPSSSTTRTSASAKSAAWTIPTFSSAAWTRVPPAVFRDLVSNQFTDWAMSPAAGEANGYLLTMKPSVIAEIRTETMDQALETITRRINALGLTEPTIAFTGRGDDEILVQLPGEGDPTRAKAVIQAGGQICN